MKTAQFMQNKIVRFAGSIAVALVMSASIAATAQAQHGSHRYNGNLNRHSPRDSHGKYYWTKTLHMHAGTHYTIDLTSHDFDTYLRIEDCHGNTIAFDDDGGDGLNARLTFCPPRSGEYRIVATSYQPCSGGRFSLTVCEPRRPVIEPLPTPVHQRFRGSLHSNDPYCPVRPNCYYDRHSVYLKAGCTYTIDLCSSQFDAYLFLQDGHGRTLQFDDDGGSGRNSRIVFRPQRSGHYNLLVTSYQHRETGAYTLTVR